MVASANAGVVSAAKTTPVSRLFMCVPLLLEVRGAASLAVLRLETQTGSEAGPAQGEI